MPTYVDFTTWTQVGNGNLSQTPTRSSWNTWRRDDPTAYLRGDYGAGYFGIAFTHTLILEMTDMDAGDESERAYNDIWALTNDSTTTGLNPSIKLVARQEANADTIFRLRLSLQSTDKLIEDSSVLLDDTKYYLTIVRSNSGKTVTVTIRTGSHAGPVVDTIDCYHYDFTQSLRYIFAPWKEYATSDPSDDSTGYVEYLDIGVLIITMIGGPLDWDWGPAQAGVSVVPITTDGGRTWTWGVATGTITIPVGGPLDWDWEEHTF